MAADKNAFMEKLLKERQADFDKKQEDYTKLMDEARATRLEVRYFSNFSSMFLYPNIFFPNLNSDFSFQEQVKKSILLSKIVPTFHCLNELF